MSPTSPCRRFEDEFLAKLEEGLPLDDEHLASCAECRASLRKYEVLLKLIPEALPPAMLSAGWQEKVLSRTVDKPRAVARIYPQLFGGLALAAAVAGVYLVKGELMGPRSRALSESPPAAAPPSLGASPEEAPEAKGGGPERVQPSSAPLPSKREEESSRTVAAQSAPAPKSVRPAPPAHAAPMRPAPPPRTTGYSLADDDGPAVSAALGRATETSSGAGAGAVRKSPPQPAAATEVAAPVAAAPAALAAPAPPSPLVESRRRDAGSSLDAGVDGSGR